MVSICAVPTGVRPVPAIQPRIARADRVLSVRAPIAASVSNVNASII